MIRGISAAVLQPLKDALSNKSHEEKSVFAHVQRVRPELVNDDHMLKFLEVDDFDVDVSCVVLFRVPVIGMSTISTSACTVI